ncbi:hypothetical protein [Mesorhizobium sp. WSM3860]|uniref:hypothetical protein n=1 Tax=Mesorhizobium sp. WSM3860 TaxID=2029403 RepID=UPI000BAFB490|nr:hypothetical protein [Mesorhizobium sp. WSM3860]PBC00754.1 hypothetical protein CK220_29700 [Mesorhizobium sp. WSM3860]
MSVVDLVLTVCLSASPGYCHDEHLNFESRGSLFQCMMLASSEIAKWSQEHPTFKVRRWKCAFPKKDREI